MMVLLEGQFSWLASHIVLNTAGEDKSHSELWLAGEALLRTASGCGQVTEVCRLRFEK